MPKPTDDIPHALRTAGERAWILRGVYGIVATVVAAWIGIRRPMFVVIVLGLLLVGYLVLLAWRRYEERPDRGRRFRRSRDTRTES